MTVEGIQRIALCGAVLMEQARQRTAAEHPAIATAKPEEAMAGTIAAAVAAGENLGDEARAQGAVVDENVTQRTDAVADHPLFEQRREGQR